MRFFKKNNKKKEKLGIVEGVESVWRYHLGTVEKTKFGYKCNALCGRNVMQTSIPLKTWGMISHIGEKYCSECEKILKEKTGLNIDEYNLT